MIVVILADTAVAAALAVGAWAIETRLAALHRAARAKHRR